MTKVISALSALAPMALLITACQAPPIEPAANHYVLADVSASAPLAGSSEFAKKAGEWEEQTVLTKTMLGDRILISPIGRRSTTNSLATVVKLSAQYRQPAAGEYVRELISGIPSGADTKQEATNILFALENAGIACTQRSTVTIVSDGIDTSEDVAGFSDVLAGNAELPAPPSAYLRNCRVTFLGIGLTNDASRQLDNAEMRNLKAAWTAYLIKAGVRPEDITLATSL